jgi:UTP--glucose-1-phosphate uridylyltransferase
MTLKQPEDLYAMLRRETMGIEKAVIPVAGAGTRLLPATKSQPKEMLPVGRKPVVQYVVEELVAQGLRKILFITGRKKRSIEDHFDKDPELVRMLTESGNNGLLEQLEYEKAEVSFFYVRQGLPLGLGHAIGCAEDFVGDEPFVVALGDTIMQATESPTLVHRLIQSHLSHKSNCTLAVCEVPEDEVNRYGIVKPKLEEEEEFEAETLVEKPAKGEMASRYAIAARYVFNPNIFEAIRRTPPGMGGEIQITDAIGVLLQMGGKVRCLKLGPGEKRYDIGNHQAYFRAFVDFALMDEEYGYTVRQYLQRKLRGFE